MNKTISSNPSGRKRQAGSRLRNGRLSRTLQEDIGAAPPAAIVRLVNESLRGCADEAFGAPLGRLFLQGKLSAAEFEAGKRWDRLIRRYHLAIGAPLPDPRTVTFLSVDKSTGWADLDLNADAVQMQTQIDLEIIEALRAARKVVAQNGSAAERDMRRLCEGMGEFPAGLEALIRAKNALRSLALFWGLEQPRRRRRPPIRRRQSSR